MRYRVKKLSVWIFLAILFWAARLLAGEAQAKAASSLVLYLRDYGWEPPDLRQVARPSLVVDHEHRVLVGFTVREREGLVTRTQPSLTFRIVRFSANGKADLSLSLPTNAAGRAAVYLSDTDQIIARANDRLEILQPDERNPGKSVWKILTRCAFQCHVVQSFSRHTLFLYSLDADPSLTVIHLSQQPALQRCGEAPQLIKPAEDKIQNYPESITDKFAYFLGAGGAYRWPFCDYEHRFELPLNASGRWTVLNDDLLVEDSEDFHKHQKRLEVVSSDGHAVFRADLGEHELADTLWAPVRSSERGNRIAVDILTTRGGNRILDISSHVTARRIAVYDIEAGKQVASLTVNAKHRYNFGFDLSPDGRRLAILEDDKVTVVDLEP